MAFSLLANSSSEVDKNQKMELTIGSLSFLRQTFGFDSPFRSDETGSVGEQNQDNQNV
jgi:hypothetical protein